MLQKVTTLFFHFDDHEVNSRKNAFTLRRANQSECSLTHPRRSSCPFLTLHYHLKPTAACSMDVMLIEYTSISAFM